MTKREDERKDRNKKPHHEYPLPGEIDKAQRKQNRDAEQEAEKDINADPDLNVQNENDDLDEGESARLGEENTGLI